MHLAGNTSQPPLLIILGPTAIGKTDLAIHIAQQLGGEIIGADSRQVYKYMNIGTATPTPQQQQQAPHHLISFLPPDDNLTLAEYQDRAYEKIEAVTDRDNLPLLVGGTGQYITAVEEGWSIPRVPPNIELRNELEAYADEHGNEAFHARLAKVDPAAAEKIHPNNVRRVVRAMEVYLETGTPITVLQQKEPPPYRIRVIGLRLERDLLYERADRRVHQMIDAGFIDEVQNLLDMGYDPGLPALSALGYREIVAYLNDDISLDETVELIQNSTHDFIRSQEVWFRGHDNGILWHNVTNLETDKLIDDIHDWMQG
jgi:tRNA dimethylallyltransferase